MKSKPEYILYMAPRDCTNYPKHAFTCVVVPDPHLAMDGYPLLVKREIVEKNQKLTRGTIEIIEHED